MAYRRKFCSFVKFYAILKELVSEFHPDVKEMEKLYAKT